MSARLRLCCVTLGLWLLAGCGPSKSQPEAHEAAPASGEELDATRKRECIERLTVGVEPQLHALLRSMCAEWVEQRVPGVAFALVRPGEPPIHAELGVRCNGEPAEIEASTAFRIGSVSKPITAALALGLIAEGKLSLASEASQVPGFVTQDGLPTPQLGALLGHRSGLGEIEPATLVELDGAWLPALARARAAGAPGTYHYSNAGYSLIGALLEHASGQTYARLLADRISEPLALASLTPDPTTREHASCGHLVDDAERRPIPVHEDLAFMPGDPRWMIPAGGLLSSATDLARFALAIGSDALPGSAAMLEPGEPLPVEHTRAAHPDERYGYGLRSWQLDADTRMYGHTGNNAGFVAELRLVPNVGAIVILANCGVELPATVAAAEALLAKR